MAPRIKASRACKTPCGSGQETCHKGTWSNCSAPKATTEICDGKDNDCNGSVDENWSKLDQSCSVGLGACQNTGKYVCNATQDDVRCSAKAKSPKAEMCNGIDDDCDGQTDEEWGKKGEACTVGAGACKKTGTLVCTSDATGVECSVAAGVPSPELCDGQDNNCDGQVDENLEQDCRSQCGNGKKSCNAGTWSTCTAPQPQPELCDGKDNNCDGKTDNNASCPANLTCKDGRCLPKCENEKCPEGLKCVDGLCVGDPCQNVNCPGTETCVGGRCYKPCDLVKCENGSICSNGKCEKPDEADGSMTQDGGPVTVEENVTVEEKTTDIQHDSGSSEARKPPAGCACSTSEDLPFLPFCLALCFLLFGVRRR